MADEKLVTIDLASWERRSQFAFFKDFDNPYFNLCFPVQMRTLYEYAKRESSSFLVAYLYLSLLALNRIEAMRMRIQSGQVRVYPRVHGGVTVLRDDNTFGFSYFKLLHPFADFLKEARSSIDSAKRASVFEPQDSRHDLIHMTVLPWLPFTSMSHARRWGQEDAIPKISFGRYDKKTGEMPVSVECHHALVDGYHVGLFYEHLTSFCCDPTEWLENGG